MGRPDPSPDFAGGSVRECGVCVSAMVAGCGARAHVCERVCGDYMYRKVVIKQCDWPQEGPWPRWGGWSRLSADHPLRRPLPLSLDCEGETMQSASSKMLYCMGEKHLCHPLLQLILASDTQCHSCEWILNADGHYGRCLIPFIILFTKGLCLVSFSLQDFPS